MLAIFLSLVASHSEQRLAQIHWFVDAVVFDSGLGSLIQKIEAQRAEVKKLEELKSKYEDRMKRKAKRDKKDILFYINQRPWPGVPSTAKQNAAAPEYLQETSNSANA